MKTPWAYSGMSAENLPYASDQYQHYHSTTLDNTISDVSVFGYFTL